MRTLMSKVLVMGAAIVLAAMVFMPSRAGATGATYNFTGVADLSSLSCGTVVTGGVTQTNCFYAWDLNFSPPPLGPVLTLNAGDVVNVDITFSNPTTVTVPGSNFQSSLFAVLLDGNYANCQSTPSTCQPNTSTSTVTLTDYSGPSGLVTGPATYTNNDFYLAPAILNGVNSGFTATGFAATFDIDSSDPYTIPFIAIDTQTLDTANTTAPEPGTIGLMLVGMGFLFVMRKRLTGSFAQTA
jgi:PEP-CTERM motif